MASLASVTEHGAVLYVLCFSDGGPETGPHPVSEDDLRAAFGPGSGWEVTAIEPERVETRFHEHGAPGWLATVRRIRIDAGAAADPGLDSDAYAAWSRRNAEQVWSELD